MLIYSNNFHEKLQGIAISRDYLKFNTPFCDIVDDPDYELDFNLAIGYNSALNGNLSAADSFIKNLTLNSGILDWSTLDFYIKKTSTNPIFNSAIRGIQSRFNNPAQYSDSYQQSLNQQLKDCLNSPCNLFLQTSDSIGRMAQPTSTKSASNTFGVGALSAAMTNMVDELDQAIFNKIPALFQDSFVETVQVANKAWTNTQAILAGKKNISELVKLAQDGKSFRNTENVYRYTPDVKSYLDFSATGSMILNKIKEDLGGCFDKYQYKYRYNPYTNNDQFPAGDRVANVNGKFVDADSTGQIRRRTSNSKNFRQQTGNNTSLPSVGYVPKSGKAYSDSSMAISRVYTLGSRGGEGVVSHYSIFGGLIDIDSDTIWYEDYAATKADKDTLKGIGNMGTNYRIGISYLGGQLADALTNNISPEQASLMNKYQVDGAYAAGYRHNLTTEGMETLYNTIDTGYLNDGVAISSGLWTDFLNDGSFNPISHAYKTPTQTSNRFFAAVRIPNGRWYFYKVVDTNGQRNVNLDITVGAYKHFMKVNGLGDLGIPEGSKENIKYTDWSKVKKISQDDLGPLEVRICQGDINDIKNKLGALNIGTTSNEAAAEDDPFSQANIDAGSLETDPLSQANTDADSLGVNTPLAETSVALEEPAEEMTMEKRNAASAANAKRNQKYDAQGRPIDFLGTPYPEGWKPFTYNGRTIWGANRADAIATIKGIQSID